MLTDDERRFLDFWEKNRERHGRLGYQLMAGLPWGALVLPAHLHKLPPGQVLV